MDKENKDIKELLLKLESLESQLFDANNIINAIKDGSVDALVVHNGDEPQIYSIESADYTYRILIEKFGEGALSISKNGLILYCNDYFARLLGKRAEKIIGTYLYENFEVPDELLSMIERALEKGADKGEVILLGEWRKLSVNMSLTDLNPTVDAIGVVVVDLTEKKKHELALVNYQHELEMKVDQLNSTNKDLEQFIHVISHDLKEPMRKILMYTSRLDTKSYPEADRNPINVIRSSAFRLDSLVDDIVKFALTSLKEEVTPVYLDQVFKDVTDDLEVLIKERAAVITSGSLPVIQGSRVQMRQLFSNLIVNAIKYAREGVPPVINISCEITKHRNHHGMKVKCYKIAIEDNGIGMDPAYISKIFVIFQRLHLRNEYSGNGIGLSICKKIMENHGGRIEVESELDKGSTFKLFFPIVETT